MAEKPRVRVPAVRAFDAGRAGRRMVSIPSATQAINAQIRFYGATVQARSRYLTANNPYAASAKESFVAAMVAAGIVPSSGIKDNKELKEEIQTAFRLWTDEADADWLTDFYGLQALIAAEMFEAGECFVRIRPRRRQDGLLVPMQLQLIPAEMLPHNDNRPGSGAGSARVEMGIEFDAIGRRVAYHFLREHPGNPQGGFIGPGLTTRVDASEILHLFRPVVAGQIRGVPHTVSAVAKLAMMDQYDDAELERKRVASLFGGFIKQEGVPLDDDDEDGGQRSPAEALQEGLEPGLFVPLNPGESIDFAEPADVGGNYEVFQYRTLTSIAAGFGVPYAAMTGDLRMTSYSSIRAGLVEFRRRVEAMQHHVMVYQFCRPVWDRWFRDAVQHRAITGITRQQLMGPEARKLMAVTWRTPHWEWVDPLDDLKAEKLAVDNGFKARSDVIESFGEDPDETDQRIAADRERAERLNLTFPGTDPERSTPAPTEGAATNASRQDDDSVVVPRAAFGRR
jgi:lambda family phage portal protein